MKRGISFLIGMLLLVGSGSLVHAVEGVEAAKPAMDPAMMEKMQKATSPSESHKLFEQMVGRWNYTSKFWMGPNQKPEETSGTSENTLIYGGRFLKQEVQGTWMGQPFEGTGYTGFDNIKQTYISNWIDSMGTGIMKVSGSYNAATKTLELSGVNSCPMTGSDRENRTEWKILDADHQTYSSFLKDESGNEFKAMEIAYVRAK